MADPHPDLTVYYDGSCPLCRAEIGHYRRQRGADRIDFVDVSDAGAPLTCEADRGTLMARFHVKESDGRLYSGAEAFSRIWVRLPSWSWAARLARIPGITPLLELAYRGFLPVRPVLSRWAGHLHQRRSQKKTAG